MRVNRQSGCTRNCLNHRQTHRNVRHKTPVHHVNVKQRCTSFFHGSDLLAEPGEVCRENRWGNFNHRWKTIYGVGMATGGRRFAFTFSFPRFVSVRGVPLAFALLRTAGVAVVFAFRFLFVARLALPFWLRFASRLALVFPFAFSLALRFARLGFSLFVFSFAFADDLLSCVLEFLASVVVLAGASPSAVARLTSTATVCPTFTISTACGS